MPEKVENEQGASTSRSVVTIKHGKAPEVQEVDFATRVRDDSAGGIHATLAEPVMVPETRKLRRKSKSMTTKSTMTNEDDYTVVHTNTPCTTPPSSVHCGDVHDVMEVGHKMVGWKMTPRVHFPPPNTLNATSLRTSELKRICKKKSEDGKIDPPFIHRPDRTMMVHQHKPLPMQPVTAWPGYGGNVYFHPVQVDVKPIRDRSTNRSPGGTRSKSAAASSHYTMSTSSPDIFSMPRYNSNTRHVTSPSLASTRRPQSRFIDSEMKNEDKEYINFLRNRQMSRLDKKYILNLPENTTLNEDWSWIRGTESLGSLKIGNPLLDLERHSTNETFTRHSVVEKVPRNFVYHPTNGATEPEAVRRSKLPAKLNPLAVRKYCFSHGIPETAFKQFVDKYYRNADGHLKFPAIPLRVKGKGVPENEPNISLWHAPSVQCGKPKGHVVPVVSTNEEAFTRSDLYAGSLDNVGVKEDDASAAEGRFSNLKDLLVQHYKRSSSSNLLTQNE